MTPKCLHLASGLNLFCLRMYLELCACQYRLLTLLDLMLCMMRARVATLQWCQSARRI